jgi:hypothetical protein
VCRESAGVQSSRERADVARFASGLSRCAGDTHVCPIGDRPVVQLAISASSGDSSVDLSRVAASGPDLAHGLHYRGEGAASVLLLVRSKLGSGQFGACLGSA